MGGLKTGILGVALLLQTIQGTALACREADDEVQVLGPDVYVHHSGTRYRDTTTFAERVFKHPPARHQILLSDVIANFKSEMDALDFTPEETVRLCGKNAIQFVRLARGVSGPDKIVLFDHLAQILWHNTRHQWRAIKYEDMKTSAAIYLGRKHPDGKTPYFVIFVNGKTKQGWMDSNQTIPETWKFLWAQEKDKIKFSRSGS